LQQWLPQNRVVLGRNPRFRDAGAVQLDRVIYFPSSDADAAVTRFRAGELDIDSGFPGARVDFLRAQLPKAVQITPTLATYYLAFNTTLPKLSDARVRLALSMALDRDILAGKVMRDGSVAAAGLVPPATAHYQAAPVSFLSAPMSERLVRARALLAEAGYGPGKPLQLTYSLSNSAEAKRIAIAVAAMWKPIGVEVALAGTEAKVMFANLRQGNFEVAYAAWTADFNDAASFLYILQSTSTASNYSRYTNSIYDGLLAQAAQTPLAEERADLLRRAEALALANQPIVPLLYGVSKNLVAADVRGWAPNAADVHLSRYLSIDRAPAAHQ
jgi:oligopeptide transport system substrate-binding protein